MVIEAGVRGVIVGHSEWHEAQHESNGASRRGEGYPIRHGRITPSALWPRSILATLYRTESRLLASTRQADIGAAFRDGAWRDPSATMLGSQQESWLTHALQVNACNSAWQMVGMGAILGRTVMPTDTVDWLKGDTSAKAAQSYRDAIRAATLGLPMWMDRWDGYPATRERLLRATQRADADLVMLSGDSHNAWAYALSQDGKPVGVEFAGHSVTSGGIEGSMEADPKRIAQGFIAANTELARADTSQRGYMMMMSITQQRVSGEWLFMRTIALRDIRPAGSHRMEVERGHRCMRA